MAPLTTLEPISAGFRGRLAEIRLPSLLCILELERRTGFLDLSLEGGKARLHLRKGRVLRAHRESGEGPRDAELIYSLIDDSRGTFDFRPCNVALGDRVRCSTSQLLLEGIRRMNERSPEVQAEPPRRRLSTKAAVAALVTAVFILAVIAGVCCSGSPAPASSASAR